MLDQKSQRVIVAMSGGVDSSVAAALLVEQGFEVIGIMLKLWSEPDSHNSLPTNRCCTPDQMADARRVARQLDIPFYVIDIQDTFQKNIVQFFIDEHLAGRTPNPCIACNREIRFGYLLDHALALEAQYLATGHYARVQQAPSGYQLLKGVDDGKDQSYVLSVLNQEQLAHVLFPVGVYSKENVRELARQFNLPIAEKSDSQDLCFVADGDYRRFLRQHSDQAINPGPILDPEGRFLGTHDGLSFYTIGQRKGLDISAPTPLYVLRKEQGTNALIVGHREALGHKILFANGINWVSGKPPESSKKLQIKIRYRARPVSGSVIDLGNGAVQVDFEESVIGITPGQGVVFYDGSICLGGGIITGQAALNGNSK